MKNMEKINELLDLYFEGETTIEQERELKQYFASDSVLTVHKKYQPFFEIFEIEKSVKYPENTPKIKIQNQQPKRFRIQIISTAIAACLLLMFGIFGFQKTDNYVVVNGKRINDKALAMQMVNEKILKVSKNLDAGMKPFDNNINKIKKHLKPLQKLENIQNTFNTVQNSINKINI